jgi:hypothetical protein
MNMAATFITLGIGGLLASATAIFWQAYDGPVDNWIIVTFFLSLVITAIGVGLKV